MMDQRQRSIHAFVTSGVDALYAGAPKAVTGKLEATATTNAHRPMLPPMLSVSDTRKFNRGLTSLLHDDLHWLDVPDRVSYKLSVTMYHCLHGQAPRYLAGHLITSADVASRLRLRSANRHQLIVPRCRLNTYGRRVFSISGPTVWNSLSDELRDAACDPCSFKVS